MANARNAHDAARRSRELVWDTKSVLRESCPLQPGWAYQGSIRTAEALVLFAALAEQAKQGKAPQPQPQSARAEGNNVVITYEDGTEEVRSGGSRSCRNNNPGNLRPGLFANKQGAIGAAGGFAVFPNEHTGQSALIALLRSPSYRNLTVSEALARFAPPQENDTASYQRFVQKITGINGQTRINTLRNPQMHALVTAIRRIEGWIPGTLSYRRLTAQ